MLWDSFVHNVLVHPLVWLADVADAFVRLVDRLHEHTSRPMDEWSELDLVEEAVELELQAQP